MFPPRPEGSCRQLSELTCESQQKGRQEGAQGLPQRGSHGRKLTASLVRAGANPQMKLYMSPGATAWSPDSLGGPPTPRHPPTSRLERLGEPQREKWSLWPRLPSKPQTLRSEVSSWEVPAARA